MGIILAGGTFWLEGNVSLTEQTSSSQKKKPSPELPWAVPGYRTQKYTQIRV